MRKKIWQTTQMTRVTRANITAMYVTNTWSKVGIAGAAVAWVPDDAAREALRKVDGPESFAAWLADIADTYASHTITVTGGLVLDSSSQAAGVITPILSGGTLKATASFTIHIVTMGGREDDRTFYLKIQAR